MNSAVIARQSMRTLDQEPSIDEQLHVLGKIIRDFEKIPDEASHRLCQDLRAHLGRIREAAESKPDQVRAALDFLKRVRGFDPRRAKEREADTVDPTRREYDPEDRLADAIAKNKLQSSKPVFDGYKPDFVNAVEAVARVAAKYGSRKPEWDDAGHTEVLQIALGDLLLDEHSVPQLWLSLAYAYHDGSFPGNQHSLLLAHICGLANGRKIGLPRPNCFKTFLEEVNFRS